MRKHTPGPWDMHHISRKERSEFLIEDTANQSAIAYVQEPATPSGLANARLIAAAPELLEALKRCYQQAVEFLNEGDFKRHVEWDAGYIVDAIAKAEGRS